MPTKRDYLVSKNLAKPGRGRFSREAVAELERARQSGVRFEDEGGAGSSVEDPAPLAPHVPAKVKNYPKVRDLTEVVGYTSEGHKVASGVCFKCAMHVSICPCSAGITASSITARWSEESEPYGRPIDQLVKS